MFDIVMDRLVVLLVGGVGIILMMVMLCYIVQEGLCCQCMCLVILFYVVCMLGECVFDVELVELVVVLCGVVRLVCVFSDIIGVCEGDVFDVVGCIDMNLFLCSLLFGDYEFYLCGLGGFMQGFYDGLCGFGISDECIYVEVFGLVLFICIGNIVVVVVLLVLVVDMVVLVIFMESFKEVCWMLDFGSLLELVEVCGLLLEFSCCEGYCGSCCICVLVGEVIYLKLLQVSVGECEVLLCCVCLVKFFGIDVLCLELVL